jgi:hypothetical protein
MPSYEGCVGVHMHVCAATAHATTAAAILGTKVSLSYQ